MLYYWNEQVKLIIFVFYLGREGPLGGGRGGCLVSGHRTELSRSSHDIPTMRSPQNHSLGRGKDVWWVKQHTSLYEQKTIDKKMISTRKSLYKQLIKSCNFFFLTWGIFLFDIFFLRVIWVVVAIPITKYSNRCRKLGENLSSFDPVTGWGDLYYMCTYNIALGSV